MQRVADRVLLAAHAETLHQREESPLSAKQWAVDPMQAEVFEMGR
jgi:hypothetical protein